MVAVNPFFGQLVRARGKGARVEQCTESDTSEILTELRTGE